MVESCKLWREFPINIGIDGKSVIKTWQSMRQLLRHQFICNVFEEFLYQSYPCHHLANQSIRGYIQKFYELKVRSFLIEHGFGIVLHDIWDLIESIKAIVELRTTWYPSEAVNVAYEIEFE